MTALVPCLLTVFAYCAVTVWRSRALAIGERRAVLGGFAVYLVFAINDVLHAARVIQSVRLFDYAFVAVAAGLHYLLVARFNRCPPIWRARWPIGRERSRHAKRRSRPCSGPSGRS